MWHLFKFFFVVFFLQVFYFLWSHWNDKETVFVSRQPRRYSSVVSKQRHTFLEKILYSSIQLFSRQWNHYNIVSLQREEQSSTASSHPSQPSDPPAPPERPEGVHKIEVTAKTKYLLVGYHSRSTLDLVYLVMNLECNIFVIHILYYLPMIKHILPLFGLLPAKDTSYQSRFQSNDDFFLSKVLESERPVLLLPGGAMECMKDFDDVFQLRWRPEMGFARIVRNYYLSKETGKEGEEKVRIKIVPFYTRYGESLFYTTETWYTSSGRTVRQLMERFQENYLNNISLLPVILLNILFSFGFFLLPLPLPTTTVLGKEIDFDPATDVSAEAFTKRIKESLEGLMSEVHREEVAGRPIEEPVQADQSHRPARPSSLPAYDELLFKHSLLYSPYETTWLEKIYLFALGFFGIVGNIFLQLIGVSSLCLTYILLRLLTPVFRLFSASIVKDLRKQKIS